MVHICYVNNFLKWGFRFNGRDWLIGCKKSHCMTLFKKDSCAVIFSNSSMLFVRIRLK